MTRGALYARVSTARQEEERTIDSQLEALKTCSQEMGLEVTEEHIFVDDGWSGSRLDRPAMDALRDAASEGRFDALLVYSPDRLARRFLHQQLLLEELGERGVEVVFLNRPISESPEDQLLVQMQGVFAEYERAKIAERMRRGKLHKARMGQWLNWSTSPYGYRVIKGLDGSCRAELVEEEVEWVREIFSWVIEDGMSARQVAKRLNERGVKPRKARIWTAGSVYRLLTNPTYAGTAYYNRTYKVKPKRRRRPGAYTRTVKSTKKYRPKEQWVPIPVPAIVTPEDQGRVQERLKENRWQSPRNTRHEYLLRNLVVCGECGLRLSCTSKHSKDGRYMYYACGHRTSVDTGRPEGRCRARWVRSDRLDTVVWDALCQWLQDPEVLRAELDVLNGTSTGMWDVEGKEAERLRSSRDEWERQIQRLLDAYQAGGIQLSELKERRSDLEARIQATERRLEELEVANRQLVKIDDLLESVDTFAQRLREGLEHLSFEERRKVVRLLIERVVVRGEEVTIEHVVPIEGRFSGLRLDRRDELSGDGDGPREDVFQEPLGEEAVPSAERAAVQPLAAGGRDIGARVRGE